MFTDHVVALIDMDGPLADFDRCFWDRCLERGFTFDIGRVEDQRHRYLSHHIPDRRERAAARKMVERPGWFADLPVVDGAVEGVLQMLGLGWEVWFCTKPLEANATCRDDKAMWIRDVFGRGLDERVIIAPDKSVVHGTFLLDDAPKQAWLGRAPWRPVIFEAPFNGSGSEWASLPHWTWGRDLTELVEHTERRLAS